MQDAVASRSTHQGTGSVPPSTTAGQEDDSGMMYRVGQAAMVLSGAALVALAARQGRWKTIGAAALAGAPLVYRGATGHWPVPQSVAQKASDALASPPGRGRRHHRQAGRRALRLLAPAGEPPADHEEPRAVADLGDGRSHWVGKSPLGLKVEWDAEIVDEQEGQAPLLALAAGLPGRQRRHGLVRRRPQRPRHRGAGRRWSSAARGIGQVVGKALARSPTRSRCREDLRRFKQLMEAGRDPDHRRPAARRRVRSSVTSTTPSDERRRGRTTQPTTVLDEAGRYNMRAVCWNGKTDIRVETVPDPEILNPRDAIVQDHLDGDLRLRPAPLRRLHPDDGEGRHPRPRVHGRGRRASAARSRT